MDAPNGIKEWLSSAPECYRNQFLDSTTPDELDSLEKACKFTDSVQKCKEKQDKDTSGVLRDTICDNDSFEVYGNSNQEKVKKFAI